MLNRALYLKPFELNTKDMTLITQEKTNLASPDKEFIREAFDSIAPKYDFLNTILSFNLDEAWRKRARDLVLEPSQESILDLGTGSGRFLQCFLARQTWKKSAALDFSANMLAQARENLPPEVMLIQGDFHGLPFGSNEFDLVVSAFTLRSVQDMPRFLSQVFKILTPGGRAGFLCLTRPDAWWAKLLFYPYLKLYLPAVGWIFSGKLKAYQFLSESVASFQEPQKTAAEMRAAGFSDIQIHAFTFGAATLISARKPK
ncbi:MAG TPA: hypothetical protein DIS66_07685 [Candidatus Omnitrophica bacterium]|nr:hypothetical protein [Candidatus Omnitrophota bacterium]